MSEIDNDVHQQRARLARMIYCMSEIDNQQRASLASMTRCRKDLHVREIYSTHVNRTWVHCFPGVVVSI